MITVLLRIYTEKAGTGWFLGKIRQKKSRGKDPFNV